MINCLNCGAPIEDNLNKCPYCGTSYFDMSSLTIDDKTPFILKIRVLYNGQYVTLTSLVTLEQALMEQKIDSIDIYKGKGNKKIATYDTDISTIINLQLKGRLKGD